MSTESSYHAGPTSFLLLLTMAESCYGVCLVLRKQDSESTDSGFTQKLLRSYASLRSRRKHKAWGVSPRARVRITDEPAEAGESASSKNFRPFSRAQKRPMFDLPGAHAPGFMLAPASQASAMTVSQCETDAALFQSAF